MSFLIYLRHFLLVMVLGISTALLAVKPVTAQTESESVQVQDIDETEAVTITDPIELPDPTKQTIYNGSGEPGAMIIMTIKANDEVLFKGATTVNSTGQWRITVPPLNQTPTEIMLGSQIEITPLQEIETVTVTTAVAASSLVVLQLILERILRVFQIAGLLGRRRTRGFVFDWETKKPVPFAILTIENEPGRSSSVAPLKETVVSTVDGFFKTIALPEGSYHVAVDHPEFSFPVKAPKPWYATAMDFYQGESISLGGQQKLEILFVPMQPKSSAGSRRGYWFNVRVLGTVLQQLAKILSWPMALLSLVVLILYPGFLNFAIASLYLLLGLQSLLHRWQTRKLSGTIKDINNKPIKDVVIRVYRTVAEADELAAVSLSNAKGSFSFRLLPGKYRVLLAKDGLVPAESGLSYETLDLQKSIKNLSYTMSPAPAFDWNNKTAPSITLP